MVGRSGTGKVNCQKRLDTRLNIRQEEVKPIQTIKSSGRCHAGVPFKVRCCDAWASG
jgi:hypothetical protein